MSHFSLDPYMRGRMDDVRSYAPPVQLGHTMEAGAIGVIEESRFPGLVKGQLVYGRLGWTELSVIDGQQVQVVPESIQPNSLTARFKALEQTTLTKAPGTPWPVQSATAKKE